MPTQTFLNLPKEKQERILHAAIEEFGKRNVNEANLSNIISAAGISRGSLYQYFENKEDMYICAFDNLRAERAAYAKPAYDLYKKEPFFRFFEELFMQDSEYLFRNPAYVKLGEQLNCHAHGVSQRLIQRIQGQYMEVFLIAIEFDKRRGILCADVDSSALADLCVHFMTDIFIFQNISKQLSLNNLREYIQKILYIIQCGVEMH